MWQKDDSGNWYNDCPLCSSMTPGCALVWNKSENGSWYLTERCSLSLSVPDASGHVFSLAG